MNKIFRVIWNQSLQSWQVVSELAKGKTKSETNHSEPASLASRLTFPFSLSLIALAVLSYQPAQAVIVNNDGGALANGGNTAGTLSDGHAVLLGTNNTIATALNRVTSPIIIGRNNLLTVPRAGSGGTIEDAVLIGNNITVGGAGNSVPAVVAIGRNIRNVAQFGVTIGDSTSAGSNGGVAIGKDAGSYGEGATAIGYGAIASGRFANGAWTTPAARTTAIGANASALAANAVAIGSKANAITANSIALGSDSVSSEATNVTNMTIGGVVYELTDHNVSSSNSGYSLSIGNDTIKRQIKNVGAGNVSASSTDAINGSQLYHAIKGIQDTGHYGYFHVNNGSSALVGGDSNTNFGLTGYTAGATGTNSLAAGVNAKASNNEATAVGYNTTASGNHSVAMGSSAAASGDNAVAVGTNTTTRGVGIAVGRNSEALNYGTAFGSNVTANGGGSTGMSEGAVAIGNAVSSLNRFSTAVGINSYTGSERATVVGANNTMGGWADSATAVGYNITVGTVTRGADGSISGRGGDHTVALGNNLNVSAGYATVTGSNNTVQSSAAVYGNNNTVAANSNGAVVLGNNIAVDANRGDAVYLGSGSAGNDVANTTSAQIGSLTLNDFAGTVNSSSGFVSVGNSTAQRKIINLAAGNISATSTEAINGSQLYQAITNVGFNLQENGTEKSRINNNNIINFTNGSYTTANVSGANNATVKFDVVTQTITSTDGIAAATGTTAGLATAADVVSAVNNSAFKLRANGAGSDTIKAGDTLNFTNGSNILITNPSTDTINVAVVNNPTFSGLVTAQGGVNVTGGGLRVSGANQVVNFGGNKLQGIANGTANTDAVAVAQLNAVNTTISGLQTDVEDLTDDLNQAKGDITNLGLRLDSTNTNVTNAQNTANTAETNAQRAITIASSKLEQIRVRANGQAVKTLNSSSNVLNFVDGNNTAVSNDGNGNIKVDAWRTTVDKQGDDIVVTPDVNNDAKTANYTISLNSTLKQQIVDTNTTADAANTTANTANTTANAAKELAEKGLKVTADKTGTGNVSGNVEHTMALGDTLTIEAGDNVNITQAQSKISIAINKDPSLGNITATQITTGNNVLNGTGLTVGDVAITNAGINAGGKQITNVTSGGNVESNAATIGDIKRLDTNTQASVALLDDSGLNLDSTATNTANGTTIYKLGLSGESKTSLAKADSALQSFQIGANDETSFGTINQADNTVRFNNGTHTEAVRSGNNITFNVKEATVTQGDLTTDFAQDTAGVVNGTVLATTANTLRDLINTATETTSLTATSGKIDTPTDGAKLMNATKVADAINAAGFTLKDKAADTGELITAGDSVIITEGTNINVSRNGETITIKTNETLSAKSVTDLENAYNGDTNGTHAASIQAVKDIVRDNAEWKIQNNTAAAQSVGGAKNVVNFVDGTQTSASVSDATGGYNVTFNVNQTDIVKEGETYKAKDNGAGLVTAANVAAQLSDVASTLTGKGFVLNTNATTDGALGENSEKNKTVALGETVTFEADKNIQLTQKGTNVTIRTQDNVSFTTVNATTFNASNNILNGTGLTIGDVSITNANGINAGNKTVVNVASAVKGDSGNATVTNIANADADTQKKAATIGDLQAVANAGKTTLTSDGKTVTIGAATVNQTTGALNYNLEVANTELTVTDNKVAAVAADNGQKFVNATSLATALNGIGFKLQENSTEKGAVTAGNTLKFTDGSGTTVSIENSNGVATVKFDANTTAITVADNGVVTEPTDAKQLITAQDVAKAIKAAGFTLKTAAGTEGEKDDKSTADEVINTGEAVEIVAGKNLKVKQAANGQITLGTLDNVTFTNVNATQVNATTFNAGGNILNGTGLTIGDVSITNANGINAGNKTVVNVASAVKGDSGNATVTNIANADADTQKNAATIGDLQAVANAGKTTLSSDNKTVTIGAATVNQTTGALNYNLEVANTELTVTDNKVAAVAADNGQKFVNATSLATALNDIGFKLQQNTTDKGAVTAGHTLNFTDGNGTTVSVENNNGVATVKFDANTTAITVADNGAVTEPTGAKQLITAQDVAKAIKAAGFTLKTAAGTEGEKDDKSTADEVINTGEAVEIVAGKNLKVKQATNGQITLGTLENVTFTNVDATQVNATTFKAGGNILNDTGLTIGTVSITNANGINAGDKAITNVNSTVKGTSNAETAKNIVAASGDTLKQAATIGDLQAATNAGKTEVKGSKQATVTSDTGGSGQTIYTVAATKTTLTSGNSAALTINDAQEDTNGVIAYTATINTADLSAENSKIKEVANAERGKLMTVEAVASAINSVGFNLQENATAKGAMLVGDTLNIANGNQTAVSVTSENNVTTVKVNVNQTDIVKEGETYKAKDNGAGLVTAANVAEQLSDVATTLTGKGFVLNTNATTDGALGENSEKNKTVTLGETVTFEADKNIQLTQKGANVTIRTQENVSFTTVNATTFNASNNILNGTGLTIGDVSITNANGINAGNKTVVNVASAVKGDSGNATVTNIANADADTQKKAATIGDLQAVANAGKTTLSSDNKTVTIGAATVNQTTGALNYNLEVANTELTVTDNKVAAVAADNGQKFVNATSLATALNGIGFKLQQNTTDKGAVTAGHTLNFTDGNGTTVSVENNNGVATVKFDANTTAITVADNGAVTEPTGAKQLITAQEVAKAIKSAGFTLKTSAGTDGEKDQNSSADEVINTGETVEIIAGKNLRVKQAANGQITLGTLDNVTFTNVDATQVNATTFKAGGNILNDTGLTIGTVSITNANGINAGDKAITNVNSTVKGTSNAETAKNIVAASGDTLKQAATIGDLQAATNAGKTEVKGSKQATVTSETGGSGQTIYTVAASKTTLTSGNSAALTINNAQEDTNGVIAYTATINTADLSAENSKIKAVENADKGKLMTVEAVASAINSVGFNLQENATAKGAMLVGDTLNIVNGDQTAVNVTNENNVTTVKVNVNQTDIVKGADGNYAAKDNGKGLVTAANVAAQLNDAVSSLTNSGIDLAANVVVVDGQPDATNVTHKLGNRIDIVKAEGEITEDGKTYIGDNLITKVTQDEDGNSKVEIGLAKNIEVDEIVLSREPNTTTINGDGVKVETKDGDAVTAETQLGADGVTVSGADGESALGQDGLTVVDKDGNEATVGADGLSAVNGAGDESKVTAEGVLVSNDKGDITGVTADGVAVNGANGTSTLSDNTLAISGKDGQDGILATVTEQGSALSLKGKDGENGITFTATDGENGKSEIRFNDNNGVVDGLKGIVNAATPTDATSPIDITTIQGENRTAYNNQAVSGNDLFNLIDNGLRLAANVLPEGAANVTHKLGNRIDIVKAESEITEDGKTYIGDNLITKVTQDEDGNSKVEIGLAKNIEVEEIVLSREPNTTTINGDGVKVETKDGDAVTAETQLGADGVTVSGADGESALGQDGLTVVDKDGNEATVGADGLSAVNGAGDESKVTAEGVLVSNDKGDITGVTADGVAVNGANGTSTLSDNTLAISGKDGQDGILATVTEQGSALSLKGKDGENGITFTATDGENGKSEIRFNDNNGVVDGLKGIVNAATPTDATSPIDITTIQGENRTAYNNQAVSGNDLFNLIDNGLRLAANVLPEGAANVTHKLGNRIDIVKAESEITEDGKTYIGDNLITKVTQDEDGNSKVEIGLAKNIEVEEIVLSREPNTTTINGDGVKVETKDGDAVTAQTTLGADGVGVSGEDGASLLEKDGLTVVNPEGELSKVTAEGMVVTNNDGDITGVTADGVAVNGANGTSTLSDNTLAISGKDGQDGILATVTDEGSALSLKGKDGENGITFTATDGENGKSEIRFNDNNGVVDGLKGIVNAATPTDATSPIDITTIQGENRTAYTNQAVSGNDLFNLIDNGLRLAANVLPEGAANVTHKLGNRIDIVKAEGEITEDGKTYIGDNLITKVTQDEDGNSKVEIGLAKNIEVEEIVLSREPNTTTINGDGVKVETKDGDAVTAETQLGADGLSAVNGAGDESKVTAEGVLVSNDKGDITGVTADGVAVNGANGTSTLSDNTLAISGKDGQDGILATVTEQGSALSLKGKDGENGITFTATDGENGKSEIRFNDNNGVVDGLKGIVNAATPENATPIDITTIQGENRTAYTNQAVSGNDLFNLIDNGLRLAANVLPEGAANVTHKLGNRIDIVKAEGEITEDGKTYIGDNLITKVTQDEEGNSKVEIGLAKNIEVEEIVLTKEPNTTTINGDGVKVETKDGDAVTAQTTLGADGVGVSGEDGASLLEKDGLTVVNPEGELSKVTAEGMVVTNNDGDITGVTADGVAVNGANGTSTLSDNTLAISGKDGQDGILATVTEQGSALSLKGKDGENGITFTATDGENGKSEIRFNDNNGVVDGLKGIVNAATPENAAPIDITTIQDENRTAYNNQAVSGNDLFNLIDNGLRLAANVLPEGAANVTHKLGNQINIVAAEEVIKDASEKEFVGTNVITKVTQDEDGNSKVEIGLAKNLELDEIVLSREPNTTTINGDGMSVVTKEKQGEGDDAKEVVTAETKVGADGVSVIGQDGNATLGQDGLVVSGEDGESALGTDGLTIVDKDGNESTVGADGLSVVGKDGETVTVDKDGVTVKGANGTSALTDNALSIKGKDGKDGINASVTDDGSLLSIQGKDGENGIMFTATDGENGKSEIRFNDNNGVVDGLKGIVNAATPENAAPIDITTIQDENRTAYNNQAVSGNDLFNLIDNGLRLAANVLPEGAANVTHKLGNQINIVAAEEVIKDASEKEFVGTNVITKVTQDDNGNSKVEIGLAKNIEVEEIVLSKTPNTTTINGDGVKVETKDGDAVTAQTTLGADGVGVSGEDGASLLEKDGLTVVNPEGELSKVTAEGMVVTNNDGDITGVTADGVAVNGANGTSTLSDNTLAISGKDGQDGILATVTEQGSALSLKGKDGENGITFTATDGENGKSEIRFNDNNGQINGLQDRTTANASDYGVDENVNRAATEGAVKAVNDRLNSEVDRITSTGFGVGATVGETQTHQLAKELEIVEAQSDIVDGDKTYVGSNLKTRVTQDESGKTTVEIGLNKNIQLDQLELKDLDPETAEVKDKTLINPTGVTVSGKDGEDGQSSLAKDGLTVKGKDGNDAVTAKADTDGNGSIKVNDAQGNNGVTISAKDGVGTIGLNGKDGANSSIQVANGVNNLAGEAAQRLVYTNGENVETIASFNDGLAFSGDDNAKVNRTLNTELTLKGGAPTDKLTEGNIAVVKDTADGANGLNIKLAQDVKDLNSVTVGKDPAQQAVLTQDRFAMTTTDGTNSNTFAIENTVNGAKISGVADGDISPTSTEAVNGSQLYSVSRVVGSGDVSIVTTTDKNGNAVEQLVSVDKDGNQYTLTTYNVEGQTEVITNSVITAIHNMNEQGIKFFHTNDGVVQVREEDSNTIDSSAKGKFATAVGYQAKADGEAALAIGRGSQALGDQSVAIGTDNVVRGNNAGAFGDPNIVDADGSYAFGNNNTIGASATNSFVVGSGNNVQTENTYVLGSGIQTTLSNSVFLGNNSGYVAAGRSTAGNQAYENALINGQVHQYAGGKAREVVGVVSVGNVAADGTQETRRIQNVAPGLISRYSTDAINGSQLYSAINNFHAGMNQLGNRMNRIDHDLRSGIAGAVAIGTLVQAYNPSDSVLAIGGGTYRGASAVALGYSKVSDNGRVILKVSGSMNNAGHYMGGASIGYKF